MTDQKAMGSFFSINSTGQDNRSSSRAESFWGQITFDKTDWSQERYSEGSEEAQTCLVQITMNCSECIRITDFITLTALKIQKD